MSEINLDVLLQSIMMKVTEVMGADRSTLFLVDARKKELWSKIAQGANVKELRFPIGKGIAGYVAQSGETLNIEDAYEDSRFNKNFDKQTGYRTKTILCMPIKSTSGKIIGVTQVLNKKRGKFLKSDESLLDAFSSLAAISIENALVYKQIKSTVNTFELFVPKKFINRIAKEGLESIELGSAEQETVSVLFSDIRNFTTISETMTPNENLSFLNSYLNTMSQCVSMNDGFIDKFIGDAIMAIFDTKPADDSVKSAIDMQHSLKEFNNYRISKGRKPIDIGIGINTGPTIIGTIGSNDRMDSTVIGDTVNLASRLESLNKLYKTEILISDNTYNMLENKKSYFVREIDKVNVKGKKNSVKIYEVFNNNEENIKDKKMNYMSDFEKAKNIYRDMKWKEAKNIFSKLYEKNKHDQVLNIYIQRCHKYELNPPENWNGSIIFDFK